MSNKARSFSPVQKVEDVFFTSLKLKSIYYWRHSYIKLNLTIVIAFIDSDYNYVLRFMPNHKSTRRIRNEELRVKSLNTIGLSKFVCFLDFNHFDRHFFVLKTVKYVLVNE